MAVAVDTSMVQCPRRPVSAIPVDGVRAQRDRSHSNGAVARQVCCEVGFPNLCSLTCA